MIFPSALDIRPSSTTMAILLIRIKLFQPEIVQLFVRCGGFASVGTKLIATMFNQVEQVISLAVIATGVFRRDMFFDAIMQNKMDYGRDRHRAGL
jgi:hypothetical protein